MIPRAELIQARQFIDDHLDEPLTIAQLAQEVGLSPFHFARLFKMAFGKSPRQFILMKRLERSHALLVGSEWSLTQIALTTGFGDQSHLGRCFRQHFGKTPREVRQGGKHKNSKILQNSPRVSP